MQISLNFPTASCNLKISSLGPKLYVAFLILTWKKNMTLKSQSPWLLLNKNIKFNKNETELKMENHSHTFTVMNLVLQLV